MHGSMRHICATMSDSSFPRWALSDRIGSSYALLALCREARTWLQLQDARVELAILQMLLDPCHEVPCDFWSFVVCIRRQLTSLAQVRMNGIRMVIAVAQLGPSQMRHMIKHAHGCVCQVFYNCISGAVAHLQHMEHDSEEFTEMTLVIFACTLHAAA